MLNRREFASRMAGTAVALAGSLSATPVHAAQAPSATGVPFRFSVMLWTLTKIAPFEKCIEIVAQAGYNGVELVGEWRKWTDADFARVAAKVKGLGMVVDSMAGVHGAFADPTGTDALLADVQVAFEAARRLGCRQLILTSGKRTVGLTAEAQQAASIENLKRLAEVAEKNGGEIVIEPIDLLENPTMSLISVTEAFAMVRAVGSPRIRVLYDFYHEQKQAGNLMEKFEKNLDLISLFHVASVPGRNEPHSGEVRYESIYRKLAEMKYSGFVTMEYYPVGDPVASLRTSREEAIRAARGV